MIMMRMKITGMIVMVLISTFLLETDGSAIPMWEFLSREEKMTHLYRIFNEQAKIFCKQSKIHDCYKTVLLDGLQNLIHMDEYILDTLDPYQRNAKLQIWHSLIGNKIIKNRIDDSIKNSYDNNVDSLDTSDNDENGLAEGTSLVNDYVNPSYGESYPSGPYIIRVYPDGRPVPISSNHPKPYDDDLDELIYYHSPSLSEISTNIGQEKKFNNEQQQEAKVLSYKYNKGFFNNGINYDSIKSSIKFSRMPRTFGSK